MSQSPQQTWDIKRFWQTLTYFEVFPFFNCLQRFLLGQNDSKRQPIIEEANPMTTILVLNATSTVGSQVVNHLLNRQLRVRILDKNIEAAHSNFGDRVEIYDFNHLSPDIFQSVLAVINCEAIADGQQYPELLNLARENLPSPDRMIFDFTQPTEALKLLWGAVDDVVMGGVSRSQIQFSRDRAIFSGQVSTANNGGFASVRNRNFSPPLNLSDYEGLELRIQGDGKRYKFITRCEGKWDGISYCYSFDSFNNIPQTIRIPFKALIPVFRAKTVPEQGKFDPTAVYSLQLMYSKFEYDGGLNPTFSPGFFSLEIEQIKAYAASPRPQWIQLQPPITASLLEPPESLLRQSGLTYCFIPCSEGDTQERFATECVLVLHLSGNVR
jgi:uncharacterized protein YbjT (DUF2867 family)